MKQLLSRVRPLHVRTSREVVEVVAILLAGFWALYVFVYENRIKPTLAPPIPSVSVTIRHTGNDGGLAVIRLDDTISNPGGMTVHFLGYALTVLASNVTATSSRQPATTDGLTNNLRAYYRYSRAVPVFREAFVTHSGDPRTPRDLVVEPGQTLKFNTEFYVPLKRFDHLTAWVNAVYTKSSATIPTTMTIKPSGLPQFTTRTTPTEFYGIGSPIADLDLKGE